MKIKKWLLSATCLIAIFAGCKKSSTNTQNNSSSSGTPGYDVTTTVAISRADKYQTIDGFGFFGAMTVWWETDPAKLYNDQWADMVINDLGLTIWRNELFPPSTSTITQPDWSRAQPVVAGLVKTAQQRKVPLKFILTVWSPPASMKVKADNNENPVAGTPNPGETQNGGTLDPGKYADYGNYLADAIQAYKNSGATVYALSPQNEPLFVEPYNSCVYSPTQAYPAMLKNVIPVVKARFPDVKIFAAENMLGIDADKDRQYFYSANLIKDAQALAQVDVLAYHGYVEGITPTESSKLPALWTTAKNEFSVPANKPLWMTETSGYGNTWLNTNGTPGAIDLGVDIFDALYYGNVSAWIWWQGSGGDDNFSLMSGPNNPSKKYYASKQFYRFIRPGSRMVKSTFNQTDGVLVAAFENTTLNTFTVVLINPGSKRVKVTLNGANLPTQYDMYQTTAADNCVKISNKVKAENIVLPPSSIVTLVDGSIYEQ